MTPKMMEEGDYNEGDRNVAVMLKAETEYYTPVESTKILSNGKDKQILGQTGAREVRVDHTQIESSEMQVEETRPRLLEVWSEGGKLDVGQNWMKGDNTSRRASSSSSLADILNPLEEPLVMAAHKSPKDISMTMPMIPPDRQSQTVTTQIDSTKDADEEMIDIVGVNEETEGTESIVVKDEITNSVAMRQSGSTYSQQTTAEAVTKFALPTNHKSPIQSQTPSPSKKRKYTPESSPDEPLSRELQQQPLLSHVEPEVQAQILVEKPKVGVGSRVGKNSRAPTKHSNPRPNKLSKKKPKTNGEKKKPSPKSKEKSASVGLEDVPPSHA
jgi:hypothetical protein